MSTAGPLGFLIVWIVMLAVVYGVTRRFIGLTMFFAATATLYVLLPFFFFPDDADLFELLLSTVILGSLGFWVGLTGLSGFSERNLVIRQPRAVDVQHIGRSATILLALSLVLVFIVHPNIINELGTYEGRIAFQGREHLVKGVHIQVIICVAILIIWAYYRKRYVLALALSAFQIAWAVYSSDKIGLLAMSAAWFSILLFATWKRRIRAGVTLAIIGVVLPSSLIFMVFYSVLRAGITDFSLAFEVFHSNLYQLGAGGANVGDFGGPYWVFTEHLRDEFLDLTLGITYFDQLPLILPSFIRGEFADLGVEFAMRKHGVNYQPGFGFGFSPWAEAYVNFRVAGFFIQGMLFGLFTRILMHYSVRLMGLNEVTIFFQIVLITLFERGFFAGQIKATIIYFLPFIATYLVLKCLTLNPNRRPGLSIAAPIPDREPTARTFIS